MLGFLNPWGFLFAIFIPAVILLYLLKQQYQEIRVSSTFLWQKAIQDMEASVPWQKLRKSLLMFLQLVTIALFTLAVARPFLYREGRDSADFIIVLDCSASMQAEDVKPTRFAKAKKEIESFIDGLFPEQRLTLIAAGYQPDVVASRTNDKRILKDRLNKIEVTNGEGSMEQALSLAQALARELGNVEIHVYSDKLYESESPNFKSVVFNGNGKNFAVDLVSWSEIPKGLVVLSRIVNYSDEDTALSVECLANGITLDVKEVIVSAGGNMDVYWTGIPLETLWVEIGILDRDDLISDNRGWTVINRREKNKVLLVSRRNIFLEKAITLRKDVELAKTIYEQAYDITGYSLYIFDGYIPEKLPEDGHIVIFNPQPHNGFVEVGEEFVPGFLRNPANTRYAQLLDFVAYDGFHIARARRIGIPDWGSAVLEDEHGPLLIAGEKGNQRIVMFSFDVHDSDIPLKVDFPILIQNILAWLLPQGAEQNANYYAGQEVEIHTIPGVQKIRVTTPSGKEVSMDPTHSLVTFNGAYEVGVYKVRQDAESGILQETREKYFTVHIPTRSESDLRPGQAFDNVEYGFRQAVPAVHMRELWKYLAWALLVVILLEWWVYQHGY